MRRSCCLLVLCLLLMIPCALAQQLPLDAVFDAVEGFRAEGFTHSAEFFEAGPWMSAVVLQEGQFEGLGKGTQLTGLVFDLESGERICWDDLFVDGDAAAERIESIIEASTYNNTYSEFNAITPIPRDNFAVSENMLIIYYPVQQLSHFSGLCGAYSFYAYELSDLLQEGIPLQAGDVETAKDTLQAVYEGNALPGPLTKWAIGGSMIDAKDALGLVDVPDLTYDYAVYRFMAPEMRGVSLLSLPGEDRADTAIIAGIMAERIDFGGLCTGITSKEDCIAALGNPNTAEIIEEADGYSRLPIGETLCWYSDELVLEMHFTDNILYSVTIRN